MCSCCSALYIYIYAYIYVLLLRHSLTNVNRSNTLRKQNVFAGFVFSDVQEKTSKTYMLHYLQGEILRMLALLDDIDSEKAHAAALKKKRT